MARVAVLVGDKVRVTNSFTEGYVSRISYDTNMITFVDDDGEMHTVHDDELVFMKRPENIEPTRGTFDDKGNNVVKEQWDDESSFPKASFSTIPEPPMYTTNSLSGEVRTTSRTGGQKGVKPERHSLIPIGALNILAAHYAKGAEKYDDNQWRKGYEWSKSYDAMQRHMTAFWGGEDIDPETGSPHLAAAAWHAFALLTFMSEHPDFDDRFKR